MLILLSRYSAAAADSFEKSGLCLRCILQDMSAALRMSTRDDAMPRIIGHDFYRKEGGTGTRRER
jgi:hypothetical protein